MWFKTCVKAVDFRKIKRKLRWTDNLQSDIKKLRSLLEDREKTDNSTERNDVRDIIWKPKLKEPYCDIRMRQSIVIIYECTLSNRGEIQFVN